MPFLPSPAASFRSSSFLGAVACVSAVFLAACSGDKPATPAAPPPQALPVTVVEMQAKNLPTVIELMAQTVAAWSGYQGHQRQEEPQIGLLLGARKYQCHLARLPAGSLLTIDCEQLLQDGALASFQCYLRCDGELVAEARLSTIQPDAEQLETLLGSTHV